MDADTQMRKSANSANSAKTPSGIMAVPLCHIPLGYGSGSNPDFVIVLRPLPGWPTSGEMRLRALLKAALRGYGLRCVRCSPINTKESFPRRIPAPGRALAMGLYEKHRTKKAHKAQG